jgi:hypothetical protein
MRIRNLDFLEDGKHTIRLHCGSNNNPTVGQFVDARKTNFINGLAFRGLRGTNCKEDDTSLLDSVHSFVRGPYASPSDPSMSHSIMLMAVAMLRSKYDRQWSAAVVQAGDMKIFLVVYVSGFIAKKIIRLVSCDACEACLASQAMLSANAFIISKSIVTQNSASPTILRRW